MANVIILLIKDFKQKYTISYVNLLLRPFQGIVTEYAALLLWEILGCVHFKTAVDSILC